MSDNESSQQPRDRQIPVGDIPVAQGDLVGREEQVDELRTTLLGSGSAVLTSGAAIQGLGGIGKTQLAANVAWRFSNEGLFPGGIFWLDAENPDLEREWGDKIARELGLSGASTRERSREAIQSIEQSGLLTLVVLDNVNSWTLHDRVRPLPSGGHIRILVTTRNASLNPTSFESVSLETLGSEASRDLVVSTADRDVGEVGLAELTTMIGGHPLALVLAGSWLRENTSATAKDYVALLREAETTSTNEATTLRTARSVLEVTWNRISQETREGWLFAAQFAPVEASIEFSVSVGLTRKIISSLEEPALVTVRESDSWQMHPLISDFARNRPEAPDYQERYMKSVERVATSFDDDIGFQVYGPNRAHYYRALEIAETMGDLSTTSSLSTSIGRAARSQGDFDRAREYFERALHCDLERLPEDDPTIAARRSNLAVVLHELGDLEGAFEVFDEALADKTSSSTVASLSNLAALLRDQGQLESAKELLEQAVATTDADADSPSLIRARYNLASVLQDLGDLSSAKELLEEVLATSRGILGDDHPQVAIVRSNLASVLREMGDLESARSLLVHALRSDERSFGEDHPNVSIRRSNLALVLQGLGDLVGARELLEQALASGLENLGADHPNVATTRSNLARVLQALGDLEGAMELLEQALASDLENLGSNHPSVAIRRSNLALVLQDLGDLAGAKTLHEQALASDLENLGEDHPNVAVRRSNLAGVLKALGDLAGAKTLHEQALNSNLKNLGKDHPNVAISRSNLAVLLWQMNDVDGAQSQAAEARRIASLHPEGSYVREGTFRVTEGIV